MKVDLHSQIYAYNRITLQIEPLFNGALPFDIMGLIIKSFQEPDYETRKIKNAEGELVTETETVNGREFPKRYPKESDKTKDSANALLLMRFHTHYALKQECEVSPAEIKLVKDVIYKQYPDPLLYQQACDILDGRDKVEKSEGDTLTFAELYDNQPKVESEITLDSVKEIDNPEILKQHIKNILTIFEAEKSDHPQIKQFLKPVTKE